MTENNAINKELEDLYIRKTTGDPYIHIETIGAQDYSFGIDDDDSDKLKITDGSDPSSGTEYWMLDTSTSTIETPVENIIQSLSTAGNIVSNTISNTDNTDGGSAAALFLTSGGTNSGDPFVRYRVSGAGQYSQGIDNTDADKFKITDGGNPSLGNEFLSIKTTGDITFNGAYEFPTADGTANQILVTDGVGNLDWQDEPSSGEITNIVTNTTTTTTSVGVIPYDNTIPQQTEGTEILTLAITPKNASNTLIIEASISITSTNDFGICVALFQDATANAIATSSFLNHPSAGSLTFGNTVPLQYIMTAGTTSSTTFKIRVGKNNAGTSTYVNGTTGGSSRYGGTLISSLKITEIV